MSDVDDDEAPQVAMRLRHAMVGRNQADVAARAGISTRTLQRYLEGANFKLKVLVSIADACSVSLDWLVTGRSGYGHPIAPLRPGTEHISKEFDQSTMIAAGDQAALTVSARPQYVAIPRYNIAASAGGGALAEHAQVVEYFAFDIDFVRNRLRRDPKHLVLIEARGDSMEPTVRDGDILTVDITPDQALQSSTLYVIRLEEALMVKRLDRRIDGSIVVHSDNTRYPPETVAREQREQLHILGQVILVSAPPR